MLEVLDILKKRLLTVDNNVNKAIEKGLLNTTNWYNRHRDEKVLNFEYPSNNFHFLFIFLLLMINF
jgi:hypothetical protein